VGIPDSMKLNIPTIDRQHEVLHGLFMELKTVSAEKRVESIKKLLGLMVFHFCCEETHFLHEAKLNPVDVQAHREDHNAINSYARNVLLTHADEDDLFHLVLESMGSMVAKHVVVHDLLYARSKNCK